MNTICVINFETTRKSVFSSVFLSVHEFARRIFVIFFFNAVGTTGGQKAFRTAAAKKVIKFFFLYCHWSIVLGVNSHFGQLL